MVGCNIYSNGRVEAVDTWSPLRPRWNTLDDDQVRENDRPSDQRKTKKKSTDLLQVSTAP